MQRGHGLPEPLPPAGRRQHGLPRAASARCGWRRSGFRDVPLRGEALDGPAAWSARDWSRGRSASPPAPSTTRGRGPTPRSWSSSAGRPRGRGGLHVRAAQRATWSGSTAGNGVRRRWRSRAGPASGFTSPTTGPRRRPPAGSTGSCSASTPPAPTGSTSRFDVYPYPTGSSIPVSLLPERGPGGRTRRDPPPAAPTRRAPTHRGDLDRTRTLPLADLVFSYLPRQPDLEGMSLARPGRGAGAARWARSSASCCWTRSSAVGHLGAPPRSVAVWHQVSRDCMALLARPDYMVCSDITPAGRFPHPRSYGAFPRFLGRLRREVGGLTLEAMVQRMTDRPARRFGLSRRGRVAARLLRGPGRLRRRPRHRHRHLRRPAPVPGRHPLRRGQRPARGRPRALHRRPRRPGGALTLAAPASGSVVARTRPAFSRPGGTLRPAPRSVAVVSIAIASFDKGAGDAVESMRNVPSARSKAPRLIERSTGHRAIDIRSCAAIAREG